VTQTLIMTRNSVPMVECSAWSVSGLLHSILFYSSCRVLCVAPKPIRLQYVRSKIAVACSCCGG
jgi:hypothetical protein